MPPRRPALGQQDNEDVRMTLRRISSILLLLLVFPAVSAFAQAAPKSAGKPALAYLCSNVSGATVMAPRWQSETDGLTGHDVRLVFGGADEPASVVWRRGDTTYYESDGVGLSLKAGFAILVLAEVLLEVA
ncbi:MAG: hypothetical protein JW395_4107 [Nitrospira sp.]|nr:hypothetical protein [Nitrospira sp.]